MFPDSCQDVVSQYLSLPPIFAIFHVLFSLPLSLSPCLFLFFFSRYQLFLLFTQILSLLLAFPLFPIFGLVYVLAFPIRF